MSKFVIFYLLLISGLSATQLQFEIGQTSSPVIVQKYGLAFDSPVQKGFLVADSTMKFTIQITSIQPLIELDLTVDDVQYLQSGYIGLWHPLIDRHLNEYRHIPFHFVIHSDRVIEETTGRLADIYSKQEDLLYAFSPATIQMILAQMFQLNKETLVANQSYPIDCLLLMGADQGNGNCLVTQVGTDTASALCSGTIGNATIGVITMTGDVTWDLHNSMSQTRHFSMSGDVVEPLSTGLLEVNIQVEQTWQ